MKFACPRNLLIFLLLPMAALAQDHEDAINGLLESEVRGWLDAPELVEAVRAQNQKHDALTQAQIDSLDQQWRTETNSTNRPLIESVLSSELSGYLKTLKENGQGLYTEIFVMDARGLNVGQSDVTSDYWQGDEAKWQETFLSPTSAVHIGEIEHDESAQMFQSQLSVTIVDPDSGDPIGAVTVGVNVDALFQ